MPKKIGYRISFFSKFKARILGNLSAPVVRSKLKPHLSLTNNIGLDRLLHPLAYVHDVSARSFYCLDNCSISLLEILLIIMNLTFELKTPCPV